MKQKGVNLQQIKPKGSSGFSHVKQFWGEVAFGWCGSSPNCQAFKVLQSPLCHPWGVTLILMAPDGGKSGVPMTSKETRGQDAHFRSDLIGQSRVPRHQQFPCSLAM